MLSMTFAAHVPPTATLPLRCDRPWWSDVCCIMTVVPSGIVVGTLVNVTKPGHCMMIIRFASHIIVSAMRFSIMSAVVVNAVAVSRLLAALTAASVMPSAVALVALHAAVVTI